MEITGKVFKMLPLVTGQGKNGEWRKQEFVIEIESGQFPKKVCLSLWGDKIDQAAITEGETVKAFFDLESREYNGRWFTEARAWRVEKGNNVAQSASAVEEAFNPPLETESPTDDLPF
jgi:hypothetical protein